MPLADEIRPTTLNFVVGQHHLLNKNKPFRRIVESGKVPNMIFYGPPGTGKTTVARIVSMNTHLKWHQLNATQVSTVDIKNIVSATEILSGCHGVLLYIDEIQYLNRKQQQILLQYIEDGSVTLVASTTENPYFYIYKSVLSRCVVFEFKLVDKEDILVAINRAFEYLKSKKINGLRCDKLALDYIASNCAGDVRKAINMLELSCLASGKDVINLELVKNLCNKAGNRYDINGDEKYDLLSALQKSIRGSDENAALHYMARILDAGDIISLCRRIMVIACEDIGLAYPNVIVIVKACVDVAMTVGIPEARIPLADAVVLMSTLPKSNSAYVAINKAIKDVKNGLVGEIPRILQNKHCDGMNDKICDHMYKCPHDFPNHFVKQQYMPNILKDVVYYEFGENKLEQRALNYRNKIMGD